jgi:hypothetical protein
MPVRIYVAVKITQQNTVELDQERVRKSVDKASYAIRATWVLYEYTLPPRVRQSMLSDVLDIGLVEKQRFEQRLSNRDHWSNV